MSKGKLIVIEGVDSSGKETQAKLLHDKLSCDYNVEQASFPNYGSKTSDVIEDYLSGRYGDKASDVNPYAISLAFALDRFDSYKTMPWGRYKEEDKIVVLDRYVSSNLIHQASKLNDEKEIKDYVEFMTDLEYNKVGLPKPDITFFLDVHYSYTFKLNEHRKNKFTGEDEKDIHEKDKEYIKASYLTAKKIAVDQGWVVIQCLDENGDLRSIEDINTEIINALKEGLL